MKGQEDQPPDLCQRQEARRSRWAEDNLKRMRLLLLPSLKLGGR
jgi:hypothetical protein